MERPSAKTPSEACWWAHKVSLEREVLFWSWGDLNGRARGPGNTEALKNLRKAARTGPALWSINL